MPSEMTPRIYLTLNECKEHKMQSISLDEHKGDFRGGTRLTSGKCCGRWTETNRWPMNADALQRMADECESAIAVLEEAER